MSQGTQMEEKYPADRALLWTSGLSAKENVRLVLRRPDVHLLTVLSELEEDARRGWGG